MAPVAIGADLDHGQERPERLSEGVRVVVKVGSSSLTCAGGELDLNRIDIPIGLIAGMRSRGHGVVLVSSGVVVSRLVPLGLSRRPNEFSLLQTVASMGQGRLAARWETAMSAYRLVTAQVLLIAHGVAIRSYYRTVRAIFDSPLSLGIVPIISENDAVATSEFNLGSNNRLAALVAYLVTANVLVLLTDVDGLWTAHLGTPGATSIRHVRSSTDLAGVSVSGRGSFVGTGGMTTELQAATTACTSGTTTLIIQVDDAAALLGQEQVPADLGAWFEPAGPHRPNRRSWMAHAPQPDGRVLIDAGAARALTVEKKSLLLPDLTGPKGDFEPSSVVDTVGSEGVLARGIRHYVTAELHEVLAARAEGTPVLGHVALTIHRDNLAEPPRIAGV